MVQRVFESLKCHYDKNHIFSIEAIQKKINNCLHEKKNAAYYFQISLFVPEIFKFLEYANQPSDDVIYSTKFCSNMMKKDISANLNHKCLIPCNKIVLKCAPQFEHSNFIPMATYWVPDLPKIKGISGHPWRSIFIFAKVPDIHDPTSI